jgi:uncharacterized SAM-binding protein YcdF (DUF218 family)
MIRRILKYILLVSGSIFLILLILCFTSVPFWTWYRMSTKYAGIHRPPDAIVILGGGGMPSESGLMRCWYGAKAANYFKHARVIVALPGDINDSMSSVNQMKKELILHGVQESRIMFEDAGTNTRAQALNIVSSLILNTKLSDILHPASGIIRPVLGILIITSPEHLYRAVLTFKKAGFHKVDGLPAFETAIESGLSFNDKVLGGKLWMPSIGKNITLRYRFWSQLHYEQLIIREWLAIAFYKLNNWV